MAGDLVWKPCAQPAPRLATFLPRRNFSDLESGHCRKEWRREIGPHCIAGEIRKVKRIPHRVHNVASEREPWIGAFLDDGTRGGLNRDPVGRECGAQFRLAKRGDGRPLLVKRDRHLTGI